MFTLSELFIYALAAAALVITPGPGQMLVLAQTASRGRTHGVAASFGLELGTMAHTVAAALGLSVILATSATAFAAVKYIGAAYLVYLGIKALRERHGKDGDDKNIQKRTTTFGSISQAALTGILNPKVAIFFLAFLPQFVRPERGFVLLQFLTLGLILAFIGFVIDCALTFIFHRAGRGFLKNPRFAKWRERVSGTVLIGLGVRLALTEQN